MSNLHDEPPQGAANGSGCAQEISSASAGRPDFPKIGTPEWDEMNRKRAELIRKKVSGQLTKEECEIYEFLQSRSLAAIEAACPRDGTDEERVAKLEKRLQGETSPDSHP